MRLPNSEVLKHTEHYLKLLSARELSLEDKQAFIQETVENYASFYNRGFITYRKSVTEAGQFAAIEWSGPGLDPARTFSAASTSTAWAATASSVGGINHPKIVQAVTHQMARMALNSQELLEPWRACAGAGAGGSDAGRAAELLLHQQRHRRDRRRDQARSSVHQGAHLHLDPRRASTASPSARCR